nr:gramicidin S synthetase 2, GS2 [Bacillus brevis, Peptide Partial, 15 aa] [Brevibacillus brevis]
STFKKEHVEDMYRLS